MQPAARRALFWVAGLEFAQRFARCPRKRLHPFPFGLTTNVTFALQKNEPAGLRTESLQRALPCEDERFGVCPSKPMHPDYYKVLSKEQSGRICTVA